MTQIITTTGRGLNVKPKTNIVFVGDHIEYLSPNGEVMTYPIKFIRRIDIS